MSKNLEQNFSLKDWVTRRAANMPEQMVDSVAEPLLQAQNGESFMRPERIADPKPEFRVEKPRMTEDAEEAASVQKEDIIKAPKMTARIANTSPGPMTTSPAQQIQIVRLLRDLGDRLRQSEKEREILWRELDSCRKLLTDIEDKTSKTEQAFLTIENKMNSRPANDLAESNEFRKAIEEKISALETTTGSAVVRLEDVISENAKLARRLEESSHDKKQLLHKIEAMEEIVTQTQEALRAKALVLLTDQALASRTALPQTNAWSGNDTLKTKEQVADPVLNEMFGPENTPWWKTKTKVGVNKIALVSLITLGLAAGWGLSKTDIVPFGLSGSKAAPEVNLRNALTPPVASPEKTSAAEVRDDADMKLAAIAANEIEPGETLVAKAAENEKKIITAEEIENKAQADFDAQKPQGLISSRISRDTALPVNIKAIENKAFTGEAEAQHDLAAIYTAGHAGVKTNYSRASQWFTEAAYNGVANAQYNLAVLYHQGLGVKQDTAKAISLYEVAASNNHPEAQYNLGIAHIEGIGAEYNPQIAAHYFEAAAKNGVLEAAYNLGLIYENGLLGEAQPNEALFWYKLAADNGNAQAKEALVPLIKQLNLSGAEVDAIFAKISAERGDFVSVLTKKAPPKAAAPPAPQVPKKTAAPVASVKKAVPVGAPSYDPVIVAQIQEQLIRLGLFSGSADGTANERTVAAVKSYQSMNKLKEDGKPNEDLLVHMLASDMQVQAEPAAGVR